MQSLQVAKARRALAEQKAGTTLRYVESQLRMRTVS